MIQKINIGEENEWKLLLFFIIRQTIILGIFLFFFHYYYFHRIHFHSMSARILDTPTVAKTATKAKGAEA